MTALGHGAQLDLGAALAAGPRLAKGVAEGSRGPRRRRAPVAVPEDADRLGDAAEVVPDEAPENLRKHPRRRTERSRRPCRGRERSGPGAVACRLRARCRAPRTPRLRPRRRRSSRMRVGRTKTRRSRSMHCTHARDRCSSRPRSSSRSLGRKRRRPSRLRSSRRRSTPWSRDRSPSRRREIEGGIRRSSAHRPGVILREVSRAEV
jgi:hypothetical protein